MKKVLLFLFILGASFKVMAQDKSITGRVIDSDCAPIDGVVVVMLAADSTHLATAVTPLDGNFSLPISELPFTLIFEHLAFESLSKECDKTTLLGDITLIRKSIVVEEVTVKGYRPIVKAEDGKLSYDLTQLNEKTTATNVYEALSYLPGVNEENGVLTLSGVGATAVIINGKPSTMSAAQLETMLKTMPIERIESAEVMYSTPPQYGVRGASINLVLTESRDYSYSGQVKAGYAFQRENSWGTGGSFMVSTPKWSADAMYHYNDYYSPQISELSTLHTVGDVVKNINQYEDIYSKGKQHSVRAAFDYTPTEKSSLSVVYSGEITPSSNSVSDSKGSYVESISDKIGDSYLHNVALRYKAESGFDIGADYTSYKNSSSGYLGNLYSDDTWSSFDIKSGQNVERLNFYTDMSHTLDKGWSIDYGAKATWAEDKDYQYYSAVTGDVETFDTDSRLREVSTELYSGFSKNLSKGSLSASLTGEYYNLEGEERWSIYPQANFLWMFDQKNILQANVSSDKTYPSYWMLQDAISYVDGYTEIHGNPYLRPMRDYSAQVVYILKRRYIFVLFGSQTNDYFVQNAYLSPDKFSLIYKNINFDYSRQYGVNAIIPFSIGKWLSSKATLTGVRMEQECSDFFGSPFNRSAWVGIAKLNNTFNITDNLSLELNAIYQTPAIQGLFDLSESWGVDAGVRWSLLDKKLDITAKCSDIFHSRIPRVTQNYGGQQLDMYTGAYTRTFSLNVSYTFGGYTQKQRKEVDSSRFGH
ncbi:MAG: outer membrane beta-barrel protein [Rikenellaceae bacterium]